MAKLSEMILGETARNLDLIDRPATLLRRGEVNRQQDLAAESALKTAKQNRTIKTRVDARAREALDSDLATDRQNRTLAKKSDKRDERETESDLATKDQNRKIRTKQEARDAALHTGEVDIQSEEVKALKNERFVKEQEIAQKYVAPVVPQMIELNKQYLETGDNDFKVQRDKLLDQFASNQAMKAYIGMTPQFHELSGLNKMHLYGTDQTPDEKEQQIQSLLLGLGKSDQVYKTWQQEQATKSAAFVLSQQVKSARQLTEAEGYGETDYLIDRDKRFNAAGIEAPPEERSAGAMTNERQLEGQKWGTVLKRYGFSDEELASLDIPATKFANMDPVDFKWESDEVNSLTAGIQRGEYTIGSGADAVTYKITDDKSKTKAVEAFLKTYRDLGYLDATSPFVTIGEWMKREPLSKLKKGFGKTEAAKKPTSIIGD